MVGVLEFLTHFCVSRVTTRCSDANTKMLVQNSQFHRNKLRCSNYTKIYEMRAKAFTNTGFEFK